jgi:hypothetical protein
MIVARPFMTTYATSNWELATMFALAVEWASAAGADVIMESTSSAYSRTVRAETRNFGDLLAISPGLPINGAPCGEAIDAAPSGVM